MNRLVTGLLLAALAPGCAFFAPLPKPFWVEQYKSLENLPPGETRLAALATMTESAAHDGDTGAVLKFLREFRGHPQHDELAGRCAAALAGRNLADGEDVADQIEDTAKHAEVWEKIHPKPQPEPEAETPAAGGVAKLPGEKPPPEPPDDDYARRPR